MKEQWSIVDGTRYEISNQGRVRYEGTETLVSQRPQGGYLYVSTGRKWLPVHRLVAIAFVPNTEGHNIVHHIDQDKTNNQATNLEWVHKHAHPFLHLPGRKSKEATAGLVCPNCEKETETVVNGWFRFLAVKILQFSRAEAVTVSPAGNA